MNWSQWIKDNPDRIRSPESPSNMRQYLTSDNTLETKETHTSAKPGGKNGVTMDVTDEDLSYKYKELGSVWKTGAYFGISGQQVHKRLKKKGLINKIRTLSISDREKIETLYRSGFKRGDGQLDALCKELGRTKQYISRKARDLGLTNSSRKLSESSKEVIGNNTKSYIKKKGHPKGHKGKKHSAETRKILGKKSADGWKRRTEEENGRITLKQLKTRIKRHGYPPRQGVSWKQGWRTVAGRKIFFRSRWEANYGRYLQWLKDQREIKEWDHEPDTFWFEKIKRGVRSYLPDFRITENNGKIRYVEVKGWMDSRSKTKLKRMAKYYPEIDLSVVDGRWFKENNSTMRSLIQEWE